MKPTQEQQAVADIVSNTKENLVVLAGAGTGKTSTLRHATNQAANKKILYCAYNRATKDEAEKSFPKNVTVKTVHGLAYAAIGRKYKDRLNGPRMTNIEIANRLGITENIKYGEKSPDVRPATLIRIARETLASFRYSSDSKISIKHAKPSIPPIIAGSHIGRDISKRAIKIAETLWEEAQNPYSDLPFSHDDYLKMWALTDPELSYDTIMLDEAQDSNPLTADLIKKQNAQTIAVGDSAQQLYAWRGAQDALKNWPAKHRLHLSQSFRFGPAAATEANKWLKVLDSNLRLIGDPNRNTIIADAQATQPNAILCRTNGGAVSEILTALENDKRPAFVGGTKQIIDFAASARDLKAGKRTSHAELWPFESWQEVQTYVDEEEATELGVFVNLIDRHGSEKLMAAMYQCVEERYADITISTVHKAKGREWPVVRISNDFKTVESEDEIDPSDAQLNYVAITRGQLETQRGPLSYIDEYLNPSLKREKR